jgi:hypothetical protein
MRGTRPVNARTIRELCRGDLSKMTGAQLSSIDALNAYVTFENANNVKFDTVNDRMARARLKSASARDPMTQQRKSFELASASELGAMYINSLAVVSPWQRPTRSASTLNWASNRMHVFSRTHWT